ncbi:genetic suppressor element 1 isoform X2 [Parasteatoda tepidariorum]|uniref:genetic suppressor element 1 isoform X2 n=1 Tax=Parasteatoda tepidariorum TaxID=114398 RepID=UPI001C71AEF0|nr:genetic suppressor element 1 isoform X2 [Parasteatoda tepidariorum]
MSLNDYFAANGAVYLRPVGLPDCFPLPGLPHGCKPPPLAMQHPCSTPQKPRTMAAVSPLHQVVPPQPNIPSYDNTNLAFNSASRTSSFAAALRKLAKQAGDPVTGEKDLTQISPVSSPVLSQGSLTPKRNVPNPPPPPMFLTNHQVSYASSSPPVVTIAPSRPVATHTSESRKVNSSGLSNGHVQDSMGVKLDSSKSGPRNAHSDKWEDAANKGLSSTSSQVRPHATIAPLPRPDDSLTSSRGFQPYRGTEESRNTLPHHMSLFDPHPAVSYPYTPAFLPPPHLSHPAYRFDDPLYLERYSLLRPPVMPYPQPGMMAPPTAFYPNNRYAADLIAQSLSLGSANNSILNHERLKQEEERRMREKEIELDQSRNKEQERQREKEQKDKETREREHKEREHREKEKREREKPYRDKEEHSDHKKGLHNSHYGSSSSKRTESPSVRNPPAIHSTSNHTTPSATIVNSTPLNLVVQPGTEPPKKEAELWMPWQQPANQYPKEMNQDGGHILKQPALRPPEVHRHHHGKENPTADKMSLRFSPSILNEKKHSSIPNIELPVNDPNGKKHFAPNDNKRSEPPHHYPTDNLPNKEHAPHEWRHEKLQKACSNNHRKSHESKKIKDNAVQNHQRKVVNGAVLKTPTYQNEGMHARLLESEKSRLEMNGHLLPPAKTHTPVSNDRHVVPSYKSSQLFSPGKESFLQNSYADCYNPPVLKSNIEIFPVVSKLDLDAKKLEKNDFKFEDDDEKEEKRIKNFLILSKVPPTKYEHNPQKLRFLRLFGLTTHFKRKKIEFDMYLKRRKILMEDYEVPPLSPDVEPDSTERALISPVEELYTRNDRLSEKLLAEATPVKLEFLFKIGLTPITLVKKEEKERIRRMVEEERLRRHYRLLAKVNKKASPRRLFVPKSEAAQRLDHLRKLREMNAIGLSRNSSEEEEEVLDVKPVSSSQLIMPKIEQVPYLCSSDINEPVNSLYTSSSTENSGTFSSPHTKSFNKYSFKRGHSLKNEFRFIAPQPVCKNNHIVKAQGTYKPSGSSTSIGIQVDTSYFGNNIDKSLADLKSSFNWPGLDTIMEAFYRHQNEQSSEKSILTERCKQLRLTQEELKKEADSLSRKMSELLRCKRELDEERQRHQHSIDHLKQCLRIGR